LSRPAIQDRITAIIKRRKAHTDQAVGTLEEIRAGFSPAGEIHPIPPDVVVTEVVAGGSLAHWLTPPAVDTDRVLLYLHGGSYQLGSLRSHGELAARLGRASRMRVLFLEYRLAPEHLFPPH
jgi:monoterpene epsilon-lactone hydrolase